MLILSSALVVSESTSAAVDYIADFAYALSPTINMFSFWLIEASWATIPEFTQTDEPDRKLTNVIVTSSCIILAIIGTLSLMAAVNYQFYVTCWRLIYCFYALNLTAMWSTTNFKLKLFYRILISFNLQSFWALLWYYDVPKDEISQSTVCCQSDFDVACGGGFHFDPHGCRFCSSSCISRWFVIRLFSGVHLEVLKLFMIDTEIDNHTVGWLILHSSTRIAMLLYNIIIAVYGVRHTFHKEKIIKSSSGAQSSQVRNERGGNSVSTSTSTSDTEDP